MHYDFLYNQTIKKWSYLWGISFYTCNLLKYGDAADLTFIQYVYTIKSH